MAEETKPYVVKKSGTLVQAGVPLREGQEIQLTDEQYEDFKAKDLVYAPEEGAKVKEDRAKAREERRAARQQGTVVVESATPGIAEAPSPTPQRR